MRGTESKGLNTQIIDRLSLPNTHLHEHKQNLGTLVSNYSREKQQTKKPINNLRRLSFALHAKRTQFGRHSLSVNHILSTLVGVVTAAIYEGIT
jgi:hypothetical protein